MELKTIPFQIHWCPRWDKEDALFYIGKTWEYAGWTLDKTTRIDIYSTRVQLGPIRISLGAMPEFSIKDNNHANRT